MPALSPFANSRQASHAFCYALKKAIARIVGIPPDAEGGLRALIAAGSLSWSGGKPQLIPPLDLVGGGIPVSQMVIEDRS